MSNYWETCIEEAFGDAEIKATQEQIDTVISWVEGAYENYGLATGEECIPNPLESEVSELKRRLKTEESKVHCETCNGKGRIIDHGPCHSSNSECWKCRGEGRLVL